MYNCAYILSLSFSSTCTDTQPEDEVKEETKMRDELWMDDEKKEISKAKEENSRFLKVCSKVGLAVVPGKGRALTALQDVGNAR